MLDPILQPIYSFFAQITAYLGQLWAAFVQGWDWFVGGGLIRDGVAWLASVLPPPSLVVEAFVTTFNNAIDPILTAMGLFEYLLPVYLAFSIYIVRVGIETALSIPRVVAILKRVIPLA